MKSQRQQLILTGGVNLNKDPRVIRPDQLALSKNAFPVIPGILGKREGWSPRQLAVNTLGATNMYMLDVGLAPGTSPYKYVGHIHQNTTHTLVASSFNNETALFGNGQTVSLGGFLTEYRPVKFVNYRNACIAVVPGMEGYFLLIQKLTGEWVWARQTFSVPSNYIPTHAQAIDVTPYTATQYKQRMVWCNFGPGRGNWICFADKVGVLSIGTQQAPLASSATNTTDPFYGNNTYNYWMPSIIGNDALSVNGRHIEVGALDGEDIVASAEVNMSALGSQMDSFLMLLSEKSCALISGEILQSFETDGYDSNGLFGSYQENKVNFDCGCVSEKTLIRTPYGWLWAGPDEVWMLNGNVPFRVGTNIRPALLACPVNGRRRWSAAYANGVYVLQLATQTTVAAAGDGTNITSYIFQYWYLDMRQGPPQGSEDAKWYGPMEVLNQDGTYNFNVGPLMSDIGVDGSQNVSAIVGTGNLHLVDLFGNRHGHDNIVNGVNSAIEWQPTTDYSVGDIIRVPVVEVTAGQTGQFFVCTTAGTSDSIQPTWPTTSGGSVVDDSVTWTEITASTVSELGIYLPDREDREFQTEIRTRDSLLDEDYLQKLVRRVDVNIAAAGPINVTVSVVSDQSATVEDLGTNTFGSRAPVLGDSVIPVGIGGLHSEARTFRPAESALAEMRQGQIKIQDELDYIIDDSNDYLVMGFIEGSGDPATTIAYAQIQLTHGAYANINAILTEIVSKLNAIKAAIELVTGWTLPSTPFSYTDAYATTYPYMNRISMAYTTLTGAGTYKIAFLHDLTDQTTIPESPGIANVLGTTLGQTNTVYLSRSKRLCALLGFPTWQNFFETDTGAGHKTVQPLLTTSGTDYTMSLGIDSGVSPFKIDAEQIVPYRNSRAFDLASGTVVIQPKMASPFSTRNRS